MDPKHYKKKKGQQKTHGVFSSGKQGTLISVCSLQLLSSLIGELSYCSGLANEKTEILSALSGSSSSLALCSSAP